MTGAAPRILHVSHTSLVSGAEHSLLDLMAELVPMTPSTLAAPHGPLVDRARARGVPVVPMRHVDLTFKADARAVARAARDAGAAARTLAARLRAGQYDVVHANSVRATLFAGPVARVRRVPVVMHVRDVLPGGAAGRVVRRSAAHAATRIVANSQHVADAFCDGLPGNLARKVEVVDNPVDIRRFARRTSGMRREARGELGLADDLPVLAIVGQITPWKGHATALRALAMIRERHPQAVLLVVGEVKFASAATTLDNTAFSAELERLREALQLPPDAVRYLGERDDVPGLLAASDLVVAPSTVEPFGRSLAEAMAVGVPVLATSRGGPPEFIDHGRTGWLLSPDAADDWGAQAVAVLEDRAGAEAVALAGADAVRRRFSRERHAQAMLDVFAGACG